MKCSFYRHSGSKQLTQGLHSHKKAKQMHSQARVASCDIVPLISSWELRKLGGGKKREILKNTYLYALNGMKRNLKVTTNSHTLLV